MKHKSSKQWLARKEVNERDIAKALHATDQELHPQGETLPEERVYNVKVVHIFLRTATHKKTTPLQKYGEKEKDTKTTLHLLHVRMTDAG